MLVWVIVTHNVLRVILLCHDHLHNEIATAVSRMDCTHNQFTLAEVFLEAVDVDLYCLRLEVFT